MTISEEDKKSVEAERKKSFTTKRATVEGLENSLFKIFPVLDHGLVRVIDYMGDDDAIVQAARVSYGAALRKLRRYSLIRYLMRHWHSTPFEMW